LKGLNDEGGGGGGEGDNDDDYYYINLLRENVNTTINNAEILLQTRKEISLGVQ
jgi:hypothetical protein